MSQANPEAAQGSIELQDQTRPAVPSDAGRQDAKTTAPNPKGGSGLAGQANPAFDGGSEVSGSPKTWQTEDERAAAKWTGGLTAATRSNGLQQKPEISTSIQVETYGAVGSNKVAPGEKPPPFNEVSNP